MLYDCFYHSDRSRPVPTQTCLILIPEHRSCSPVIYPDISGGVRGSFLIYISMAEIKLFTTSYLISDWDTSV